MKSSAKSFLIAAMVALPLSTLSAGVTAAETTHSHGNETHGTMELNQGQKWPTDAALRQGMGAMHDIVSTGLADTHAGKLSADDYKKLSGQLMTQVTYIVQNCRLEPEADAQLHILLGNIVGGVDTIEGKTAGETPEAGLVKVAQAINSYGSYFDHPQWKAIDLSH